MVNLTKYIDWTLLTILIGLMIYAYLNGYFYHNEIKFIEICQGIPIDTSLNLTEIYP